MTDTNDSKDSKDSKDEKLSDKVLQEKLAAVQELPFDEQIHAFLRAFVADFSGSFEKVLDLGERFRKYIKRSDNQLEEHEFHKFLEDNGQAKTILYVREQLRLIDLDFNKRISIIEYLLFEYKKTLQEMFAKRQVNTKALLAMDKAIAEYQKVLRTKRETAEKIEQLKATIAAGGDDAKHAKGELHRLQHTEKSKEGAQEIGALAEKLRAQRLVKEGGDDKDQAFKEEQERVAEAKRQQEQEQKKKAEESRAKLAAKAALFGQTSSPPSSPKQK